MKASDKIVHMEEYRGGDHGADRPTVWQLHLELEGSAVAPEDSKQTMVTELERELLHKRGKVEHSISRDILAPGSMTLYGLHFAIQRLFGWQHSHLHAFALPEPVLHSLTRGQFDDFLRLCGVYFRFPDEELDQQRMLNDEYPEEVRFETWLRWHYCGPYEEEDLCDEYLDQQAVAQSFLQQVPQVQIMKRPPASDLVGVDPEGNISFRSLRPTVEKQIPPHQATLEEMSRCSILFAHPFNVLLERLTLSELLLPKGKTPVPYRARMRELKRFETRNPLEDGLDKLLELEKLMDDAADGVSVHHHCMDLLKEELAHILVDEAEELVHQAMTDIDVTQACADLAYVLIMARYTPPCAPLTDTLKYSYDFGDDWNVTITAQRCYQCSDGAWVSADDGDDPMGELAQQVGKVWDKEQPVCIAVDGLNVMDDVGGLPGYCDFLYHRFESPDPMQKEECRSWAKAQGWTGRFRNLERML